MSLFQNLPPPSTCTEEVLHVLVGAAGLLCSPRWLRSGERAEEDLMAPVVKTSPGGQHGYCSSTYRFASLLVCGQY